MKTDVTVLRAWLEEAKAEGATHVVVFSDDFSHEYYPVSCRSKKAAQDKVSEKDGKNMQRMIEVYNLKLSWNRQLKQFRSINY